MSFENYLTFYDSDNVNWKEFVRGTFIYVDNQQNLSSISELLQKYIPAQNAARKDWIISDFELIPFTKLGSISRDVRSIWMWTAPHPASVIAPPVIALLLLLIACFNFTNTSIAISSKRLKEIGIRKVMGSNRNQLIAQFMGENLVLCIVSHLIGLAARTGI